ncbi:MAG: hypothetical protein OK439_06915 [Thaumarchaeota archaeon]|nr:hypothetical protein [Nitrososphaerota archaeon]
MDALKEKCTLCDRISSTDPNYCIFHERAKAQINSKFSEWSKAFENDSWERYLETIIGLKETGVWAKEVARLELRRSKNDSKANFKNA